MTLLLVCCAHVKSPRLSRSVKRPTKRGVKMAQSMEPAEAILIAAPEVVFAQCKEQSARRDFTMRENYPRPKGLLPKSRHAALSALPIESMGGRPPPCLTRF